MTAKIWSPAFDVAGAGTGPQHSRAKPSTRVTRGCGECCGHDQRELARAIPLRGAVPARSKPAKEGGKNESLPGWRVGVQGEEKLSK